MGEPTETVVKTALEEHYEERIRPGQFHGAIDALVRQGHVERYADGLQDRLSLTDAGRRALAEHLDWLKAGQFEVDL
jgi:DNA-binding MarR family transcriptional regulator